MSFSQSEAVLLLADAIKNGLSEKLVSGYSKLIASNDPDNIETVVESLKEIGKKDEKRPIKSAAKDKKEEHDEDVVEFSLDNVETERPDEIEFAFQKGKVVQAAEYKKVKGLRATDFSINLDIDEQLMPYTDLFKVKTNTIVGVLKEQIKELKNIKYNVTVKVEYVKDDPKDHKITRFPFFHKVKARILTSTSNVKQSVRLTFDNINKNIDELIANKGSGLRVSKVLAIYVSVVPYNPIKAGSYIDLPSFLKNKKAVVNIKNNDDMCFKWSVLAKLFPVKEHPERVAHYYEHEKSFCDNGIEYPVKLCDVAKLEKLNKLSINVFGYEETKNKHEIYPLYISNNRFQAVDLLYISEEVDGKTKGHYCLIKDFNKLMCFQSKHKARRFFCRRCFCSKDSEEKLNEHSVLCSNNDFQKLVLPTGEVKNGKADNIVQFTNIKNKLMCPFIIYADFESILVELDNKVEKDGDESYTIKTQEHKAISFCYQIVCVDPRHNVGPVVYVGKDAATVFLQELRKEKNKLFKIMKNVVPMNLSEQEEKLFQSQKNCYICNMSISGKDKVRDHCHISGKFRGAACSRCNSQFKYKMEIPVVFHNLKGYDAHLILKNYNTIYSNEKLKCIPNSSEKFLSFTIGKLRFIDSFQFMACALETLASNLPNEQKVLLKQYFHKEELFNLVTKKGVFPYDYITSIDKLSETKLPSKEQFYSKLYNKGISDEDYNHAQTVWNTFECKNLKDYHNIYLVTDVLLLADIFESFRKTCITYYELDPAHYFTAPGFAWDCMLKMTNVNLELFTDIEMYNFIESGMRGGISAISKRLSQANNKYMHNYDPNAESVYIQYWDANNLYGAAMSMKLPTGNFKWLSRKKVEQFDVDNVDTDSTGYILEVDLDYPEELHDLHDEYPLAPERLKIGNVVKLVPNLKNKRNYVIHIENLRLYMKLGLKLKKIYRILSFDHSQWMKPYIDFNTDKRSKAKNAFEKDFFKLMNNAAFGKTMENVKNRINYYLVSDKKQMDKMVAKPYYLRTDIINKQLVGIEMQKLSLTLNKPIYVGFCVFELSKTIMYDFHYNYIKKMYGNNAELLFTDTDSLMYEIKTEDVYEDIKNDLDKFDTSDFPKDHILFSEVNKKVIGKFKDEACGKQITEFVGLRPKLYSFKFEDKGSNVEVKKAKGVTKSVIKSSLKHDFYKQCLLSGKTSRVEMNTIRSIKHQLYSLTVNKIALDSNDDKRVVLADKIHTHSYGHYMLPEIKAKEKIASGIRKLDEILYEKTR